MSQEVTRSDAPEKKVSHRSDFELCYLRHQYIRKAKHNPTIGEMKPYTWIARHVARNTYDVYRVLLRMVGFEYEDVVNIANIHLVSFLGLFTLEQTPEKYEAFVNSYYLNNFKKPEEKHVMDKNKANCTMFLKQRMEDLIRVCRQKARNIKGLPAEEFFFYCGPNKPPKIRRKLIVEYERLGFRKIDSGTYKAIKRRSKSDTNSFTFDGKYYVAVSVDQKSLGIEDLAGAGIDPYDSIHNMSPERILTEKQTETEWEKKRESFKSQPETYKVMVIEKFIEVNKRNRKLKEEVKTAKKLLKSLGV
jgi:hypothetical protein